MALNPEIAAPKPVTEADAPQPVTEADAPKPARGARFDDRPLMAVGIPAFGLTIPLFSGLLQLEGPGITPDQGRFWAGMADFVGLAFCIWWGNRWLLFKQREHWDWFSQPFAKLSMLVAACTLYTAPLTVAWLAGWYTAIGAPVDWPVVRIVALTNVICVIFVTHAYETLFLIRERESDALQLARLARARSEAELAALKAQVDPHFLFNGLNTLGHLIGHDARAAREFCDCLAEVYRYVLANGRRTLVPLADELAFVRQYVRLLELRFGAGAVQLDAPAALGTERLAVVPLALQVLVENAVKHNAVAADAPLRITMALCGAADEPALHVHNARRPREGGLPSAGVGLANLDERCKLVAGRGLRIDDGVQAFAVEVPLLS